MFWFDLKDGKKRVSFRLCCYSCSSFLPEETNQTTSQSSNQVEFGAPDHNNQLSKSDLIFEDNQLNIVFLKNKMLVFFQDCKFIRLINSPLKLKVFPVVYH
jgi:hypothetical protein